MYYKPTPSSARRRYRTLIYGIFIYKLSTYYKPPFRADVREMAHGLIIRTICSLADMPLQLEKCCYTYYWLFIVHRERWVR